MVSFTKINYNKNLMTICNHEVASTALYQCCRILAPYCTVRGGDVGAISYHLLALGAGTSSTTTREVDEAIVVENEPYQARAVTYMAVAMALHYLGYSFARPTTIALFTSQTTGFQSPSAFPLAMAFISPVSLVLLLFYGSILDAKGPRIALTQTTAFCGSALLLASSSVSVALLWITQQRNQHQLHQPLHIILKAIVASLFIFRESYVQLLTTQYWSFITSICAPSQSAKWFGPISGLTSILSAIGGWFTSSLVNLLGLTGVVALAGISLLLSLLMSEKAYRIAEKHGFNPDSEHFMNKAKSNTTSNNSRIPRTIDERNMIQKAFHIFERVPTLKRLFWEILSCQGLATLLNVCFVMKLREAISNDALRAGWTGRFYATINIISFLIQVAMLPSLIRSVEPYIVWRTMPIIMICLTLCQSMAKDPSLYLVSGSLLVMKTIEFSARRILDEMVKFHALSGHLFVRVLLFAVIISLLSYSKISFLSSCIRFRYMFLWIMKVAIWEKK